MPRKKITGIIQGAIDSLKELLQTRSVKTAVSSHDKRSTKRGKALVKELEKNYKPGEIAESLEIPVQKYTALKKKIKKGEVSSATLNDLLEATGQALEQTSGKPQDMTGDYMTSKPINGKKKFKIDYIEMGDNYINKSMKWAQDVKPGGFASKQSALNWYGGVTGGKEYFAIVRKTLKNGKTRWHIYDTRTPSEKSRKGTVTGGTKAGKLYKQDKIK